MKLNQISSLNKNELLLTKNNMILTLEKEYIEKKSSVMKLNEFLLECKTFCSSNRIVIELRYDYDIEKIKSIIISFIQRICSQSLVLRINYYSKNITGVLSKIISLNCFCKIIFGKTFSDNKFSFENMIGVKVVEYLGLITTNTKLLPGNLKSVIIKKIKQNTNVRLDLPKHLEKIFIGNIHTHVEIPFYSYNPKSIMVVFSEEKIKSIREDLECLVFYYDPKPNYEIINNLPNTIKILLLSNYYNYPIDFLPNSLKFLSVGFYFTQTLNNLPSSLERLTLSSKVKNFDFLTCLPDSIEHINIKNLIEINEQTNEIKKLPTKLKELAYSGRFNDKNQCKLIYKFFQTYKTDKNANFIIQIAHD